MNKHETNKIYSKYRFQVFIGIFIGYAAFYLVRKNLSLALPFLEKEFGYTKTYLGAALAFSSFGYGLSKFIMGGISDRSNAKIFLPLGLILNSLMMILAGTNFGLKNIFTIIILQFLIGWFGGMGWPACARVLAHWFSQKERGTKMAIWNTSHNIGGMIIGPLTSYATTYYIIKNYNQPWRYGMFIIPSIIAIICAIIAYILIKDNPKDYDLSSIEEYKNDYPDNYSIKSEKRLSIKEIFIKNVFKNNLLWIISIANAFIYLIRYGVLDWVPTYLQQTKGYSIKEIGWAYFAFEFAAIPGTIFCGWISDKFFQGKRAMPTIIFTTLVTFVIIFYCKNNYYNITIDICTLITIGFLIYGPVMLIGVYAIDLVPKNAAGASAGFTGFFGYFVGTAILSNWLMGFIFQKYGWDIGFYMLIFAGIATVILMSITIPYENKNYKSKLK